jgi:hypothetical protein
MSQIIYVPEIVEGRYVYFSYSGESCAIRDFIASGDRPCRDYKTSQINRMIKDWMPADRIPITDVNFWVKRLTEVSRAKLGGSPTANSQISAHIENIGQGSEVYASSSGTLEPNNFSTGKPRVIFYGERGIVNTLFIELAKNSDAFGDFIKMVKTCRGKSLYEKEIKKYTIVIEPDFGKVGFGSTDAVITINDELLILFEAKRCTFNEAVSELTYQTELNYVLGEHLTKLDKIPSSINIEVSQYSSDINSQRGNRGGGQRRLNINDEHRFFFGDFVKCSKFSCLSLTRDKDERQIARYYNDFDGVDSKNLSWIGYDNIFTLAKKYNSEWLQAHLEINRRHLGNRI